MDQIIQLLPHTIDPSSGDETWTMCNGKTCKCPDITLRCDGSVVISDNGQSVPFTRNELRLLARFLTEIGVAGEELEP